MRLISSSDSYVIAITYYLFETKKAKPKTYTEKQNIPGKGRGGQTERILKNIVSE